MKHLCTSSSDRISDLPSNITDIILKSLPLQEIVRTSVLSRNWRLKWVTVPELVFGRNTERGQSGEEEESDKYNANIVHETLLQHQGPLWKFSLNLTSWDSSVKLDTFIPILSRKGIQDLKLYVDEYHCRGECRQLTSLIFSCVELKKLSLIGCVFQPLTLVGFNKLISVELLYMDLDVNVSIPCGPLLESLKLVLHSLIVYLSIDAPNLKNLFFEGHVFFECNILTPFLKNLSLTGLEEDPWDGKFDLVQLLRSLPLLENLGLSHKFRKLLYEGDSTNKLPTVLNNLRMLDLTVLNEMMDPATLWLMKNSPKLQKLKIQLELYDEDDDLEFELWGAPNNVDYFLMNLREAEVKLNYFCDVDDFDFGFFKFLLASSPQLETLYIKLSGLINVGDEVEIRRSRILFELPSFRRASPKAQIVFIS